jgi:pilus assembly protein CpaB
VRTSSIIILFIAIVMGGAAAFLARTYLQSHTAPQAEIGTIVVASAPLAFGTRITEDKLTEIPWAASTLPQGAFATKRELLKDGRRVVLTQLERNEPVLRTKITAPGERGSLSSLLEEGKRAVTVRVDDIRGVGGFILPGDRVDVALIRTEGMTSGQSYSDVILQQVKVLAVDQLVGERAEQPTVAKAVTLEVSAEEAQKVLLAMNIGRLSLVLRQPGMGVAGEQTRRITERDLSKLGEPVAPAPAPAAAPAAPVATPSDTATVAIVRGLKREEYTVMRQGD